MAQKRMFSLKVVDTDKFLEMPTSTQALYFHLGMRGDDDGFVASPKKVAKFVGCNDDDIRLLITKGFIIPFSSGVVVITDWKINNTLKNDRYQATIYASEKAMLQEETSGKYTLRDARDPEWIQNGTKVEPQHNITKPNVTKQSIGKSKADEPPAPTKQAKKAYGEFGWVKLTDDEFNRLLNDLGEAEVKRCIAYVDESAEMTKNKNKWRTWNLVIRKCNREGWGLGNKRKDPPSPAPADKVPGVTYL